VRYDGQFADVVLRQFNRVLYRREWAAQIYDCEGIGRSAYDFLFVVEFARAFDNDHFDSILNHRCRVVYI
jgi:hypothetical protein